MKKTLLFAWMVLSGMCFIACSSDDDNNNNEPPVEERVHDLDVFTDRLITVDDLGNLEGVNIGQALNSNVAPEVYSVQVKDLEEAKAMFMELVDGFADISTALSFCTMPKERNRVRCISRRAAVPSLPR